MKNIVEGISEEKLEIFMDLIASIVFEIILNEDLNEQKQLDEVA